DYDFDISPAATGDEPRAEAVFDGSADDVDKDKEIEPTKEAGKEEEFDIALNDDTAVEEAAVLKVRDNEEMEKKKNPAQAILEGGKNCIVQGLQASFRYVPTLQSSLGLNDIGDSVTTKFSTNGLEFEISIKVVSAQGNEILPTTEVQQDLTIDTTKAQNALHNAPPLSTGALSANTRGKTPCRFGANCTKGEDCHFDHTNSSAPTKKPCTWVNTFTGCIKGDECYFSHELEGVKCNKSKMRSTCLNSYKCAFKHDDD
ncbi:uncharacterized protein K460DRAFT_262118, partial [Cucurbitaria berberidis CBS 394.84]